MKLIHCADIHLGSKMETYYTSEKSKERRDELRLQFDAMVTYAAEQGVDAVLLSGDVFDSDQPFKKDKEFFYGALRAHPEISFYYLRGNHDCRSGYEEVKPENLHTFGEEWSTYPLGEGVTVSGLEISSENASSFYDSLHLEEENANIVMLHGTLADTKGMGKIVLRRLQEKNIDYLALGHFHSFTEKKIDGRGTAVYSGCLEGRGFDECGEKGFVTLQIEKGKKPEAVFVPFAKRTIREVTVDVSEANDSYGALGLVRRAAAGLPSGDMVRIVLQGEIAFEKEELCETVENGLESSFYLVSVKDKTLRRYDPSEYAEELSLKGEFIRTVLGDASLSPEEKSRIVSLGVDTLMGRRKRL